MNFHVALTSPSCLKYCMKCLLNFGQMMTILFLCQQSWSELLKHLHIEHSGKSRSNARLSGGILSAALCLASLTYTSILFPLALNPTLAFFFWDCIYLFQSDLFLLPGWNILDHLILFEPKVWPKVLLPDIRPTGSTTQILIYLDS